MVKKRMCCNFQGCWLVTWKNREMIDRPAIFKWRQTEPGLILCAVRWYLRYSLFLRDVEELLEERGLNVDHTTVWRWVQYYVWSARTSASRNLHDSWCRFRPFPAIVPTNSVGRPLSSAGNNGGCGWDQGGGSCRPKLRIPRHRCSV